jgi:alpha-L-rhamnosidase
MSLSLMISLSICAILHAALAQSSSSSTRLRVEYIDSPLTIDVPTPRFSYALVHSNRGEVQTAYHIVVQRILPGSEPQTVWDSSLVTSSTSLNIPYGSSTTPLVSDSDYLWTITWADSTGTLSTPVTGTFSTSWLGGEKEFSVADWISSTSDTQNTYRTEFTLPTTQAEFPVRARMYITGLGYAKTWLNGQLTDDHELGQFTTFQQRTLYDVVDLTSQIRMGCNSLGVMLGVGWFAQDSIKAGPRQFRLVLSFTDSTGKVTLMASKNTGTSSDLVFKAIAGPVTADDIYNGETYDARIAANISGWLSCGYNDASWSSTIIPTITPTSFNAVISSHAVLIKTDRTYSVTPGGITQPTDTAYVFDFGQNMAGQTLLRVEDCPVGTIITLIHNEILNVDGTVNRNLAKMVGTYICSGVGGIEEYRTLFTYYGFRYVQIEGYPGIPGEEAITAFFIHSDVPQSGEFMSSNLLLNKIQHATRFASWSNLMDIPTDCPQRERRGWLGDAQLSFETVIHNVDGGGFYTKWLNDFADTQVYDNRTMNTDGALPDCIPFYGHGHPSADPG